MRLIPNTKATFGKQLPQRVSMLKNLVSRLIVNEQVVTSKARALAIRPIAELIISNALSGKQDLKAEAEQWLVNHQRTLPVLYGPLVKRYKKINTSTKHTRVYNLLHRQYHHVPMAVVELVGGPRDTLINLEKYKEELAKFKEQNDDLFSLDPDQLVQALETKPRGRMHKHHKEQKERKQEIDDKLLTVGRMKCEHIMNSFALHAVGKLPVEVQPEFWVR